MNEGTRTHESYPWRADANSGLGANRIESIAREEPLRNPPGDEAERGAEADSSADVPGAIGTLAEDGGDGALQDHGGEGEEEDHDDDESVESGLGLGEREEPQQQALALVEVRSDANVVVVAAAAAAAVVGARQLPIEGGAVAVVARVPLEGESAADRTESNVPAGVVDLRLRSHVARQSHRKINE